MESTSIRATIKNLKVGDEARFSIDTANYSTLRFYCSALGIETGNTYSSHLDRKDRVLIITRTA